MYSFSMPFLADVYFLLAFYIFHWHFIKKEADREYCFLLFIVYEFFSSFLWKKVVLLIPAFVPVWQNNIAWDFPLI